MPEVKGVTEMTIEALLIQVAEPDRFENSPERKEAWDEIKRRYYKVVDALKLYADESNWFQNGIFKLEAEGSRSDWTLPDNGERARKALDEKE